MHPPCAFAVPVTKAIALGVQPHRTLVCARTPARARTSACANAPQQRDDQAAGAAGAAEAVEAAALTAAAATLILRKAAAAYTRRPGTSHRRPPAAIVRGAMLELEKVQRANRVSSDPAALVGQWRLVCIADKRDGTNPLKTLYFPLRAHQTFTDDDDDGQEHAFAADKGIFDNAVFLAGSALFFRISGPCRWVPRANRLEFSVDTLKLGVGPWRWRRDGLDPEGPTLENRTARTLPFFTFFCVRDDIAVARGRTGGLALYTRVPPDEQL